MGLSRQTIFYSGMSRNTVLEDDVNKLIKKNNGRKGGDWSFMDKGYQMLILFEKPIDSQRFSLDLRNLCQAKGYKISFGA